MEISDEKIKELHKRLLISRMRLLCNNGFYGLLLMNARIGLDEECETAYTDGDRIMFSPAFMDELNDGELDFVMMHEVLHMALRHCPRNGERDPQLFNIACDVVVNSNIMHSCGGDEKSISIGKYGVSMHLAPNGEEGYRYTVEEVYEMLKKNSKGSGGRSGNGSGGRSGNGSSGSGGSSGGPKTQKRGSGKAGEGDWDDHEKWTERDGDSASEENEKAAIWAQRVLQAAQAMENRPKDAGDLPLCAEREIKRLTESSVDWRELLNDFVTERITDYSFSPPDRRYGDTGFFLPDLNQPEAEVENILFMVDASGSMTDEQLSEAFSEVKGAIDRFDGALTGWLGFFDAAVTEPQRFEEVEDLKKIKPKGGGGTSFSVIFDYIRKRFDGDEVAAVVILTDGYAAFPRKEAADGLPVLWLINNDEIKPPWGLYARFSTD